MSVYFPYSRDNIEVTKEGAAESLARFETALVEHFGEEAAKQYILAFQKNITWPAQLEIGTEKIQKLYTYARISHERVVVKEASNSAHNFMYKPLKN